ncbi:M23 family metallopeptidase [Aeromicrobium alkaliterrae]|uniref:M23ase beta-sheet core domain-containing protein n=1 Tax=Aeromicrobium alkaliterrae TaxID=302168 RepID=A0ABP4WFJ7_9ACTN
MSRPTGGLLIGAAAAPLVLISVILGLVMAVGGAQQNCNSGGTRPVGVVVDPASIPEGTAIAGYGKAQLINAAAIVEAGQALGLDVRDQTIGVMTAIGESSLQVIGYGDAAGPDSRGLFQQRDNGAWGTYEDRMDPFISATNFFKALSKVEGRPFLEPTIVAHRTQNNADPYHYAKYWTAAVQIVEYLAGVDTPLIEALGNTICSTLQTANGQVSASGWANPAAGPLTSQFGMRTNPVTGVYRLHAGTDFGGGGCGGPIWAAQSGVVTFAGFDSGGNGTIKIDHAGGITTAYLHMFEDGILVREGDNVQAGQQIGRVGNSGNSTGCHLHFETRVLGEPTDPVPFMAQFGITLG